MGDGERDGDGDGDGGEREPLAVGGLQVAVGVAVGAAVMEPDTESDAVWVCVGLCSTENDAVTELQERLGGLAVSPGLPLMDAEGVGLPLGLRESDGEAAVAVQEKERVMR